MVQVEEEVEVVAGSGHQGQQEVGREEMGRQVTQVWGQFEGGSLE